jgi:hypothetical protein
VNSVVPILRARLELDNTLRLRAFFSRAVRGILEPPAYRELVAQWAELAAMAVSDGDALVNLATRDVGPIADVAPCPAIVLGRGYVSLLNGEPASLSALALVGTSWTTDAIEHGAERGRSLTLLEEVARRSRGANAELQRRLESGEFEAQTVYALVEALRGVVLGVAVYLDTSFPPPTVIASVD